MGKNINAPNPGNGLGYGTGFNGIPIEYDYLNAFNSSFSPNSVHVSNTQAQRYFRRYLLQRAMSIFKWKLPENWEKNYFLYCLYSIGYIGVIETDKYGVICNHGFPHGYNVQYQPTHFSIANPLLKGNVDPEIGKKCTVFRLMPDWGNINDLINCYADMMALAIETVGVNLINSHLSYVFPAPDQGTAQTFKKMYDKVSSGQPAVAVTPKLFNSDGTVKWVPFIQNVGQNYIVSDVLSDLRKLREMFDTEIGIPNSNTDKRERLIQDEVNSNNVETTTLCEMWLEQLQNDAEQTRKLFGVDISVDWRNPPEGRPDNGQESNDKPNGII